MSNPFEFDDEEILEGFLCPICKQDLKTPERLTSHVESVHSEEQDLVTSLKDIFSKAKKKILKFDDNSELSRSFDNTLRTNSIFQTKPNYIQPQTPQEVGADCDHMFYFKTIRTPRLERYATETNKVIIRLHKLITDRPTDSVQRKQHEQNLVPWLDGKSVKLCPSCARSFHLTRRQHHCRLCGSIMCHDCSCFLRDEDAALLVTPSPSTPSRMVLGNPKTDKEADLLRICDHCIHLLEMRREMQESRTYRPQITLYHERIQDMKRDIAPDTPMYAKMVNSLYQGDSIFTLADATALRGKIGHAAETIDSLSKAILVLPTPAGSREETLKKSVRMECVKYIKEQMLSIPPLPDEAEIKRLQDKRRMETEQRIERDRRIALEALERKEQAARRQSQPNNSVEQRKPSFATGSAVASLDNWSGMQASGSGNNIRTDDPLVEQINIIKGYIKQAREALRFEEVETLELNLRELQQEFYRRQQLSS